MSFRGRSPRRRGEGGEDGSGDAAPAVAVAGGVEQPVQVMEVLQAAAQYTSPDLSIAFVAFFAILAYFHESYNTYTSIAILLWLVLQVASHAVKEDFRNDLFWSILGLLGNFVFYLFIGYGWSMAKLYIDVYRGHLPVPLMLSIQTCLGETGKPGCIVDVLFQLKWHIVGWMTMWPISVAYTLSRDPLRIITDLIFEWSKRRYRLILVAALAAHNGSIAGTEEAAGLLYYAVFLVSYFVIGYVWTHFKLFIDVWQGSLPPSLDSKVRSVYAGDKNYFQFALEIKWLVMMWILTWPLSIIYTLTRHPFRMLADFVYRLSVRKYGWIIGKAMDLREKKE